MRAIPLVRNSLIRPLLEFMARSQHTLPPALARAHAALTDLDLPIPFAIAGLLFDEAARVTGREDLGLQVGQLCVMDDLGEYGRAIRSDDTIARAVATAARLTRHFNTGERFWIVAEGPTACLHRWFSPALRRGRGPVSDYSLAFMLHLLRLATGPRWRPLRLLLEGPRPPHAARLEALAGDVRYGQPVCGVVFPRELLAQRLSRHPYPPRRGPRVRAKSLPSDFAGSVRSAIDALLRLGRADLSAVAEAAGTSARSFQRRLAESGLCFTQLVDEARFRRARALLGDDATRVVDVCADLGYTDAGNFSRAFRRWSGGLSPRQFRSLAR